MKVFNAITTILAILGVFAISLVPLNLAMARARHDEVGRTLIPEIMSLAPGDPIPQKVYKKYSSRLIGESVVARLALNRTAPKKLDNLTPKKVQQMQEAPGNWGGFFALPIPMQAREIHIYRGTKHLRQIVETGLLNMFQTETSSFDSEVERRLKAENQYAELQISNPTVTPDPNDSSNSIRPKYGVLQITSEDYFGADYNLASEQLGAVTAVLRPEVIKRATYTSEDSLLLYDGEGPTLTRAQLRKTLRPLSDPELYLKTPSQYFEVQVWGELDVRDILEWRVSADVTRGQIEILKKAGIPIYRGEQDNFNDRQMRLRGKLLYPGDPNRLKSYVMSIQRKRLDLPLSKSCTRILKLSTSRH